MVVACDGYVQAVRYFRLPFCRRTRPLCCNLFQIGFFQSSLQVQQVLDTVEVALKASPSEPGLHRRSLRVTVERAHRSRAVFLIPCFARLL